MRKAVVYLLIFLAVVYNVERLDFGRRNLIDISSIVYIIILAAIGSIVMFRSFSRLPLRVQLGSWLAVYLTARIGAVYLMGRPIWGGIYTYLTITEISIVLASVLLARNVADHLSDFEEAVQNITLADISHRVSHITEAYEEVQKEIMRSRRHNYPVSIMLVEPDPDSVQVTLNRSVLEIQQAMMTRYVLTSLMRITKEMTRRTDMIIDHALDKDSFVVFCPDTNGEDALLLANRLQNAVYEQLGVRVCCGLATFPEEALTFETLIERADLKIQCEKDLARLEHREPQTAL